MLSKSARVTTAAEARFRIDAPNSKPRSVKVIALDSHCAHVVKQLAGLRWNKASFLLASAFAGTARKDEPFSMRGWLNDLSGRTQDLVNEVEAADLVVMVATAGESAAAASVIGEACRARKVMTTALILHSEAKSDEQLSKTLSYLRPYASMLVVANGEDYIESMLVALRA